jgi:hypothetical protein
VTTTHRYSTVSAINQRAASARDGTTNTRDVRWGGGVGHVTFSTGLSAIESCGSKPQHFQRDCKSRHSDGLSSIHSISCSGQSSGSRAYAVSQPFTVSSDCFAKSTCTAMIHVPITTHRKYYTYTHDPHQLHIAHDTDTGSCIEHTRVNNNTDDKRTNRWTEHRHTANRK